MHSGSVLAASIVCLVLSGFFLWFGRFAAKNADKSYDLYLRYRVRPRSQDVVPTDLERAEWRSQMESLVPLIGYLGAAVLLVAAVAIFGWGRPA